MRYVIMLLIFFAVFCPLMYLLYRQGFVMSKSICAVLFALHPRQGGDSAVLDSCNGWARHMVRFRENRAYRFILDPQLSGGTAQVTLLDRHKQPLFTLTPHSPERTAALDPSAGYYLYWEFRGATGRCALRW